MIDWLIQLEFVAVNLIIITSTITSECVPMTQVHIHW